MTSAGRNMHLMTSFLSFFIALLLKGAWTNAEGERCGRPGRPVNGTVSTTGRFYFPGERVSYSCVEGFVLFGSEERTCRNNGTWSGEVPLCDFNLARGKRTLQSETLWSYSPDLAVDGNPDTCSFTPRGRESRWWQVHLGHKFNVMSVGVTISPGSFQEFTIYVVELLADNKATHKPCTTFKGVFQTHKALFHCNDRLGHPGQFVYIRDDRKEEEYFGLCEVEVFAFRKRIPCGDPEIPVGGEMTRVGEERADYSCTPGFTLEGDSSLTCSSRGKWQGQTPKCREVHCPPPPSVNQGFVEISNFLGVYVFGTEATYACNLGHVLKGPSKSKCDHTGTWTPESPTCEAVSCGPPPQFENAKVSLLSGSTHWNDIAVYTCIEGYSLHQDTGDPVTTCLDKGEWKVINITCERLLAITSPIRAGGGRSIELDNEPIAIDNPLNVHLIAALVVIVILLLGLSILVGLLLVRRRNLSGPGSRSPLVKSTEKQSPNLSSQYPVYQSASTITRNQQSSIRRDNALSGPARLEKDLLATLEGPIYGLSFDDVSAEGSDSQFEDPNYDRLGDRDPPYERVRNKSEHSYETIRKKSRAASINMESDEETSQDPGYERVLVDKESVGYESIRNVKDGGYETVKDKNHEYETLKEKSPGYETVKDPTDPGYDTVKDDTAHGYETVKLKPTESLSEDRKSDVIPDILQEISESEANSPNSSADDRPELQGLYAKVDLSKKTKNRKLIENDTPIDANSNSDEGSSNSDIVPTQVLISKFNSLMSDEEKSKSLSSDISYGSGTSRPLPPLPFT